MSCICPVRSWVKCKPPPPPPPRPPNGAEASPQARSGLTCPDQPTAHPGDLLMVPGLNLQCHLTPAGTLLHQAVFGLRETGPISFFTAPTRGRMGMGNRVSTARGGLPQLCPSPPPPSPTLDPAFAEQAVQPRVPAVAARAQPGTTTRTKQTVWPLCSSCSACRCHRSPQHLELHHLLSMLVAYRTTLLITGAVYVPCYSDIFFF